jgi:hypothetical protein
MTDRSPLPGRPAVPLARLFLERLIYEPTCGALGSPLRLHSELFPSPSLQTSFDPSSLVALRHRVHPARVTPPQSSFASSPRSVHLSVRASPRLGFGPLRDFTRAQPLLARGPNLSLRSVLGFSQPPDGFLRARACRLISSRCHVQGLARSGASLPVQPPSLIARSLPPCRWLTDRSPACAGCRNPCASTSRLSSAPGRVLSRPRYSHEQASLPSSSFSPSGSHFTRRAPAYRMPSARDVRSTDLRFRARRPGSSPACLSREA